MTPRYLLHADGDLLESDSLLGLLWRLAVLRWRGRRDPAGRGWR